MKWYQNIFSKPHAGGSRNKSSPKKKGDEKEQKKKKKSPKDMTSEELREAIGHLELEARYSQLMSQTQTVGRGRKFVGDMVDKAILPAAVEAGKKLATDGLLKLGKKYLGLDDESTKDIYAEMKKEADYATNMFRKASSEQKLKDLRKKQAADEVDTADSDKKSWSKPSMNSKKFGNDTDNSSDTSSDDSSTTSTKKSWEKPKMSSVYKEFTNDNTWKKGRDTVIDVDFDEVSSSDASSGRSYISGLLNSSIAGLLEEPK